MSPMTQADNNDANFTRPGAVDLSGLAAKQGAAPAAAGPGGASYVVDVSDVQEFEGYLRASTQHLVVVEVHSPRAEGGDQLSTALAELANSAGGKWLLVRIDADQHADIAQALRVQALPTVVAILQGQLAPLFQGVQPKEVVSQVIAEVQQAAVANGVVGTAKPVAQAPAAEGDGDEEAPADPRFAAADAAMEAGDFAAAVTEFDKLLAENPGDAEASAGRAQAALLARTMDSDAAAAAEAGSIEAEFAAADAQLVAGDPDGAFARLVDLVRRTSGDERDQVRVRLLELFETRGNADPAVVKARRALTSALF